MGQLAGVLFEVHALEVDPPRGRATGDLHRAAFDERQVVLGDLVALDQVRVRVVLAVELGRLGDLGAQCQAGQQRVLDRDAIHDRQHAGHAQTDRTDVRIRRRARIVGRAAAEHLALRGQLDVAFQADDGLVVASRGS